jgi:hypothetical protein
MEEIKPFLPRVVAKQAFNYGGDKGRQMTVAIKGRRFLIFSECQRLVTEQKRCWKPFGTQF